MKNKKWIYISIVALLVSLLVGCGDKAETGEEGQSVGETQSESSVEMFTNRDKNAEYVENNSVLVNLNGDSVSCDSNAVQIEGSKIILLEEASYVFRGELENGQIVVNAGEKDKVQIVLDGTKIKSETSAALYVLAADKVVVTLAAGSENTLENGGSFEAIDENNIDAAIFSKQDLTFNGIGSLKVSSPVNHGIVCKDDLVFVGGTYVVESASHGIDANDSVRIAEAMMTIAAGKDGIRAENTEEVEKGFVYIEKGTFHISSEGDGISASNYLQSKDGEYYIVTGGGSENAEQKTSDNWGGFPGGMGMPGGMPPGRGGRSSSLSSLEDDDSSTSMKGLKAAGDMKIEAGTYVIDSADDSVHSNASITIMGGTFFIESGDDAFHADDTLLVSNGTIEIAESYEGLEALHVEVKGGDVKMVCSDDGINAAGGTDSSGTGGVRGGDKFGGHGGMGFPGGMSGNSDGSIIISGGNLYIVSSGDGIDANGYLEITGGYTVVTGPTHGDTATLDYDLSGTITGGTFIGTGGSMMAQSFSDSAQGVFAVQIGGALAGTEFTIEDIEGKLLVEHAPELDFSIIIVSTEEMVKGDKYTIKIGEASGEFEAR